MKIDLEAAISGLFNHPLYEKNLSFKEIVDDCKDFFEESGFSHVQNKSSAAKERENHDRSFYETMLPLLLQITRLRDQSERNVSSHVRMLHKWWNENKTILHRNLSQLEALVSHRDMTLRVSKEVLQRSHDMDEGLLLGSIQPLSPEGDSDSKKDENAGVSRESDQIKDSSSLLELPPDIGDDEGEIQLSPGSPADSAELSHSYRDDREIIIPGASKPFLLTMPSATPLEQSPLKNLKNADSSQSNLDVNRNHVNKKSRKTTHIQMNPAEIWEEFLRRQKTEEDFATLSEFYGRHGTAYTKRYASHARSWGPEESTRIVIDSYRATPKAQVLHPKIKDRIIYHNLEDFQQFENSLADNRRRNAKSALVRGSLKSPQQTKLEMKSREVRSGRLFNKNSKSEGDKRSSRTFASSYQREQAAAAMKSSDAVVEDSFRMSDVVDSAVNELVINKEQVGPEPSRGFRQPFKAINPFKTIASQTITFTKSRPETEVEFEPPILLIPGISSQSKRKDAEEFKQTKDPMTPRTMPGQRQLLQSAGGSTSRGNRPFTSRPTTKPKDKWNSHKPSDLNERVQGAANHPFFHVNERVVEKMVMVTHLGKRRSTPWWKDFYQKSADELTQYLKPGQMGPPNTAEEFHQQGPLWDERADRDPALEYIPNIARKKNIFTWNEAILGTS
ncbi:uncharacterized protein LOC134842352 [Symsagittifera roscoffensis]|uniref:uncharacterized protein LOC134842352 n=1 Tax=Symsagittifera roscoffensis TaxID=84072 RepID=UPI00307B55DC